MPRCLCNSPCHTLLAGWSPFLSLYVISLFFPLSSKYFQKNSVHFNIKNKLCWAILDVSCACGFFFLPFEQWTLSLILGPGNMISLLAFWPGRVVVLGVFLGDSVHVSIYLQLLIRGRLRRKTKNLNAFPEVITFKFFSARAARTLTIVLAAFCQLLFARSLWSFDSGT